MKKQLLGKRNCFNIWNNIHKGKFFVFNDVECKSLHWCVLSCCWQGFIKYSKEITLSRQLSSFFSLSPLPLPHLVRHWQKWGNDVLISWCLLMNFSRRLFLHMEDISMCYHPLKKNGSTMFMLFCKKLYHQARWKVEGEWEVVGIHILKITGFKMCGWNNESNNLNIAVEFN